MFEAVAIQHELSVFEGGKGFLSASANGFILRYLVQPDTVMIKRLGITHK
jgi:hypothetical protein